VSPVRLVVPANQFETDYTIDVSDTGLLPLHVDVSLNEFAQAPNGLISFTPPGPLSAASWVRVLPGSFDLIPSQHQPVRVTIRIPSNPEPGERQVGILFKVPAAQGGANIAVSGAVATELLIAVPGSVVRKTAIGPLHGPGWADGGPVKLDLSIRNLGNIHRDFIHPQNLVAVVNGKERIALRDFTVLRGSTRVIFFDWTDPPLFCVCHIRVSSDDSMGNAIMADARVIMFPLRLVLGLLLAATGLFLLSTGAVRRRRRRLRQIRKEAYEEGLLSTQGSAGPTGGDL
jgi:hypothetical protein